MGSPPHKKWVVIPILKSNFSRNNYNNLTKFDLPNSFAKWKF